MRAASGASLARERFIAWSKRSMRVLYRTGDAFRHNYAVG
jgi:hypothetical protein